MVDGDEELEDEGFAAEARLLGMDESGADGAAPGCAGVDEAEVDGREVEDAEEAGSSADDVVDDGDADGRGVDDAEVAGRGVDDVVDEGAVGGTEEDGADELGSSAAGALTSAGGEDARDL